MARPSVMRATASFALPNFNRNTLRTTTMAASLVRGWWAPNGRILAPWIRRLSRDWRGVPRANVLRNPQRWLPATALRQGIGQAHYPHVTEAAEREQVCIP